MQDDKASWTAQAVTFFRAIEAWQPEQKRVCYDPLAHLFLDGGFRLAGGGRARAKVAHRYIERTGHSRTYGFVITRTRFIDDHLTECIGQGFEQLVIIGAGFDTRAYRFDLEEKVKVYEVDHPATQELKTRRLRKVLGSVPGHVVYVPVDFEKQELDAELPGAGYDPGTRTLFIWEGVFSYLTIEAVNASLSFIAGNSGEGSAIAFTHVQKPGIDGDLDRFRQRQMARLKRKGEPHIFGLEPGRIGAFLDARGFDLAENLTGDQLCKVYIAPLGREIDANKYSAVAYALVKASGR
jgi:methyltransferase (TIGR00027 family)